MKFQTTLLAAMIALLVSPSMAAPRGAIAQPGAKQIPKLCDQSIAQARARIAKLKALPLSKVSARTVLHAWNVLDMGLQDIGGPVGLLSETSPDPEVRKAAEACDLKLSALPNEYLQSEALFQRVKALQVSDPIDVMARQSILDDFEERGVSLPAAKRERAKVIFERLDKLSQDFARNVRDTATKLAFSEAELQDIPPSALTKRAKDDKGNYLFGLDYPEFDAIMNNVAVEGTRKAFWTAFQQRGGQPNLELLKEAVQLRLELAQLMGDSNFADWAIKRKMAGSAQAVNRFLDDVQGRVEALERKELDELRVEKVALTGDKGAVLQRWDVPFYQQRLKKSRYSVDQREVRAQFPTDPTIAWMMEVTSTLYGVQFKPNQTLPVWQADVRGYDVFDSKSGQYLSSFYLDLFPRDGKYKHAAAFPVRGVSTLAGRTPVSVLVTNFNREGFDQNELETLFHEFGHIMHGVLSKTRYVLNAGTGVKRDFVEAPSQMYEEWSRRPESLALFAKVCPSCKPIDAKLIERMNASRAFGRGLLYARQRLYAAWDMALHTPTLVDPMQTWVDLEGKTPLGYVPGTMVPAAFGHIMGGYQAGYYGYMWSEVLALDMRSAFGANVMDTAQGARYRQLILENGGQRAPAELVEAFLQRKPSPDAFFKEITGQQ
ncbi:MAG: Zn-dependent oligopeptidase [Burkholderiales bacterium]|nr:Zn-dependent oligopeptidase [Burkholderiales bacterium]